MKENSQYDKKSLRAIVGPKADFGEIAKDAVAFSNAQGGVIEFGLEDDAVCPLPNQKVDDVWLTTLENKVCGLTTGVMVNAARCCYDNGGETIKLTIARNASSVAVTSSGKIFVRTGDNSLPVSSDDIPHLMADKGGYQWEDQVTQFKWQDCDTEKLADLIKRLKDSERVSDFVKEKDTKEMLVHFFLVAEDSDYMTNLGVLFIGTQPQRGRIQNSPNLQCIKYDEYGEKVNKWLWDDYTKSPSEIIDEVWATIPEWKESQEISMGMFRRNIPAYDRDIIRELACNSLVHRPYTTRGDIFINIHPQYVEIVNPGLLPLGVTPKNILHKSKKRNAHMASLLYCLRYMEKEGSGYDKIYEILLQQGKNLPVVREGDDYVAVKIERRVINPNVANLMMHVDEQYHLRQKQNICIGLIAQHESLTARELEQLLELENSDALTSWLQPLLKNGMVISSSMKARGVVYSVNPQLLREGKYRGRTSLKRIEDYRLRELIIEDLKIYQEAKISEIQERIGSEISIKRIRHQVLEMEKNGIVARKGIKRWTLYYLLSTQNDKKGR